MAEYNNKLSLTWSKLGIAAFTLDECTPSHSVKILRRLRLYFRDIPSSYYSTPTFPRTASLRGQRVIQLLVVMVLVTMVMTVTTMLSRITMWWRVVMVTRGIVMMTRGVVVMVTRDVVMVTVILLVPHVTSRVTCHDVRGGEGFGELVCNSRGGGGSLRGCGEELFSGLWVCVEWEDV